VRFDRRLQNATTGNPSRDAIPPCPLRGDTSFLKCLGYVNRLVKGLMPARGNWDYMILDVFIVLCYLVIQFLYSCMDKGCNTQNYIQLIIFIKIGFNKDKNFYFSRIANQVFFHIFLPSFYFLKTANQVNFHIFISYSCRYMKLINIISLFIFLGTANQVNSHMFLSY
jgi:hypothetical protein